MALAIAGTPTKGYATAASSVTFAHTATGDGLFVGSGGYGDPARTTSSVTFNGDSLTELWDINDTYWGNFSNAGYLMCAPDTGSSYNVVVTMSGTMDMLMAGAVGISGLASPVGSAHGTIYTDQDSASVTVVDSEADNLVIDTFVTYQPSVTVGASQTSQNEYDSPEDSGHSFGISTEPASGANTVMSWNTADAPKCIGATALIAAAGGGETYNVTDWAGFRVGDSPALYMPTLTATQDGATIDLTWTMPDD